MAKKLKHLKVNEVSFVDAGANPGAHITLFKRATKAEASKGSPLAILHEWLEKQGAVDFDESMARRETLMELGQVMDDVWNKFDALRESVASVMHDDEVTDKKGAVQMSLEQFSEWIKSALADISKAQEISGGDDVTIEELEKLLAKQEETLKAQNEELAKIKQEASDAKAELAKLKGNDGDQIDKSKLPDDVRKHIEEQEAKNAELAKQAKENADALAEIKKEREKEVLLLKVKADYPNLPDHDGITKALQSLGGEEREAVEKSLKASNAALSGSLKPLGKDGGDGDEQNAFEKATVIAKKLRKDEPGKFKSLEAARNHVWETNPDLYKAYSEERNASH